MELICLPVKVCDKKKSLFAQDGNVVYVQPARATSKFYREPRKRPTAKIAGDTTYTTSYMSPGLKIKRKITETERRKVYAKMESRTTHKTTYTWKHGERAKTCYPAPRLGCGEGPIERYSVQKSSYMCPGLVRTKTVKNIDFRRPITAPMETTTIARESYQHPQQTSRRKSIRGDTNIYRKLNFVPDYETIQKSSYQQIASQRRKIMRPYYSKPNINAQILCETTYNTSYMIPGCFVRVK
ncbi:uncharacterized protein [Venturia canescens]|uniref:uncharacterized protein n=1 Tax=Venturia canescens TaxID=32260 RepID=UPI001C9D47B6|nr:uncharacterized protein LOC122414200 [Venturia canescens]